jgi:hypothetical protein
MRAFVADLEDGWAKDGLSGALADAEPARAFGDALGYYPPERRLWLACRQGRMMAVVRAWLEANDVEPTTEPPARFRVDPGP